MKDKIILTAFTDPMMGLSYEESAQFLKAIEPYVDIALIREADCNFPLTPRESETIPYAKKMKEMGVRSNRQLTNRTS